LSSFSSISCVRMFISSSFRLLVPNPLGSPTAFVNSALATGSCVRMVTGTPGPAGSLAYQCKPINDCILLSDGDACKGRALGLRNNIFSVSVWYTRYPLDLIKSSSATAPRWPQFPSKSGPPQAMRSVST
jgi:hypothetical protein